MAMDCQCCGITLNTDETVVGVCRACAKDGASYTPNNIDMVVDAMQRSRFGGLAQVFIMEAIHRYAEQVAEATPQDLTPDQPEPDPDGTVRINIGIDPKAWIGVAKEIKGKLTACDCGPCGL